MPNKIESRLKSIEDKIEILLLSEEKRVALVELEKLKSSTSNYQNENKSFAGIVLGALLGIGGGLFVEGLNKMIETASIVWVIEFVTGVIMIGAVYFVYIQKDNETTQKIAELTSLAKRHYLPIASNKVENLEKKRKELSS